MLFTCTSWPLKPFGAFVLSRSSNICSQLWKTFPLVRDASNSSAVTQERMRCCRILSFLHCHWAYVATHLSVDTFRRAKGRSPWTRCSLDCWEAISWWQRGLLPHSTSRNKQWPAYWNSSYAAPDFPGGSWLVSLEFGSQATSWDGPQPSKSSHVLFTLFPLFTLSLKL